jgi:putative oxidoreductase
MLRLLSLTTALDRQRAWMPLLLRIPVGATFALHGYGKVFERGILATASGFAEHGIPLGAVLGPIVPIAEFFGGLCLIVGLGTRVWAFLQAWIMIFAIAFVHGSQGFQMHAVMMTREGKQVAANAGWEWQALILAASLVLVIGGGGALSMDALLGRMRGSR